MSYRPCTRSILRKTLIAATLAAPLFACAPSRSPDADMARASVPPGSGASSAPADLVGGGGHLDEIYREIYTPGDPRWSNEY